jgi:hypothetical protein
MHVESGMSEVICMIMHVVTQSLIFYLVCAGPSVLIDTLLPGSQTELAIAP